jgi:3-hydroxy acid dehydrogenase / malonic semialdehyde reductase
MDDVDTVLVTGATSGIGRACAEAFSELGCRVIVTGRRRERLEAVVDELPADALPLTFDVRDAAAVATALDALPDEWATIDVLVNNAGLALGREPMQRGRLDEWTQMIETNVIGLLNVTDRVLPGMVERGHGHIINIGSSAGREVYAGGAVYCATKAAVDRITRGLRIDTLGTGVRVSEVAPGLVQTEFSNVRFRGDDEAAAAVYEGLTPLRAEDVADTVVWVATRPPHVQVADVLLYPTDQAGSGKVARRP